MTMIQEEKQLHCRDCWHNYHCPMSQEGYNFSPDTCPYNPDNKKENYDTRRKRFTIERSLY